MGRPANPNLPSPGYTVRTFATDADYPLGSDPWSGNPTKVEPASPTEGFVPETGASAEEVNKLFNDGYTQQAAAKTYDQNLRDAVNQKLQDTYDYLAQISIKNFKTSVSCLVFDGNGGQVRAKFVESNRTWWLVGPVGSVTPLTGAVHSTDPNTFPTSNELTGGNLISNFAGNFDADPSGNIVYPGSGSTDGVASLDYNGASWSKHAAAFSPYLVNPDVVYDVANSRWAVAGCNFTNSRVDVYSSTNRSTFSAGTRPSGQASSAGAYPTLGSDGAGKLVMIVHDTINNKVWSSTSTDGGQTWSSEVNLVTSFTPTTACAYPRPVWTGSAWVAVARGAGTSKIFTSADGLSWTLAIDVTTKAVASIVVDGALLGLRCASGEILFSTDGGTTWNYTDQKITTNNSLNGGAGRFIVVDGVAGKAYLSIATGMGYGVLT